MSNNSVRSTEVAVDDVFVEHTDLVIGKDSRGCELSHYILAERIVLDDIRLALKAAEVQDYDFLATRFAEGHRGYHNMSPGELWAEWGDIEESWYGAWDEGTLPYEPIAEDPIHKL
jgi:hypothetical protein